MGKRKGWIKATYKDEPATTYALTVTGGTGGGSFAEGTVVPVTADPAPAGQVFNEWVVVSGSPTIEDANAPSTNVTMPAGDAEIKATYIDAGSPPVDPDPVPGPVDPDPVPGPVDPAPAPGADPTPGTGTDAGKTTPPASEKPQQSESKLAKTGVAPGSLLALTAGSLLTGIALVVAGRRRNIWFN
ncbi:MAG: hypothetical protein Q4P06_08875 [Actinomycetaceae bacterium]|nr:hypothetical protein [Actinomycetaceae bacterium]